MKPIGRAVDGLRPNLATSSAACAWNRTAAANETIHVASPYVVAMNPERYPPQIAAAMSSRSATSIRLNGRLTFDES